VRELSVEHLGYFLEPEELFKNIVPTGEEAEGADAPFILDKLTKVLNRISDSTRGTRARTISPTSSRTSTSPAASSARARRTRTTWW
jgi:hypothetical protein